MSKVSLIILFEVLLLIVFSFFYIAVWTSESVNFSTISAKCLNTGFVCIFHMIFGIGGACLIDILKK